MNTKFFFLGFLFVMFFSSCSFKETMVIKEDGSGEMMVTMDGAGLMEKAAGSMGSEAEKKIDTTISFKKLFAEKTDSISKLPLEQRELIKSLENYDMSLKMDASQKLMLLTMKTSFMNVSEVGDMMKSMNKLSALKGKKPMDLGNDKAKTYYYYDGKVFKRLVNKTALTDSEKERLDTLMKGYGDAFSSSTYTMEYVFPKKVLSVSDKEAKISNDGKTVTITRNFMEYASHPENLSFQVKFSSK